MKHILIASIAILAFVFSACTIPTVRATPEEYAAYLATVEARTPPLPTVTPQVVPCVGVKANIGRDGRKLYHLPDSPNYNQIVIDESAGEKVYCTEQDAIDAGWTKAGN